MTLTWEAFAALLLAFLMFLIGLLRLQVRSRGRPSSRRYWTYVATSLAVAVFFVTAGFVRIYLEHGGDYLCNVLLLRDSVRPEHWRRAAQLYSAIVLVLGVFVIFIVAARLGVFESEDLTPKD